MWWSTPLTLVSDVQLMDDNDVPIMMHAIVREAASPRHMPATHTTYNIYNIRVQLVAQHIARDEETQMKNLTT